MNKLNDAGSRSGVGDEVNRQDHVFGDIGDGGYIGDRHIEIGVLHSGLRSTLQLGCRVQGRLGLKCLRLRHAVQGQLAGDLKRKWLADGDAGWQATQRRRDEDGILVIGIGRLQNVPLQCLIAKIAIRRQRADIDFDLADFAVAGGRGIDENLASNLARFTDNGIIVAEQHFLNSKSNGRLSGIDCEDFASFGRDQGRYRHWSIGGFDAASAKPIDTARDREQQDNNTSAQADLPGSRYAS